MKNFALSAFVVLALPLCLSAQPAGMGMSGCSDIMQQLCPDAQPGTPDFAACMKEHRAEFAQKCRDKKAAAVSGDASNPEADEMSGGNMSCRDQAAKACPGMHPGDGQWAKCMKEHHDEFSKDCQAKLARGKEKMREGLQDCRAAVEKVCPDMKPGTPDFRACAKSHEDELPPKCVRFWKGVERRRAMRRQQGGDRGGEQGGDQGGADQQGGGDGGGND